MKLVTAVLEPEEVKELILVLGNPV